MDAKEAYRKHVKKLSPLDDYTDAWCVGYMSSEVIELRQRCEDVSDELHTLVTEHRLPYDVRERITALGDELLAKGK